MAVSGLPHIPWLLLVFACTFLLSKKISAFPQSGAGQTRHWRHLYDSDLFSRNLISQWLGSDVDDENNRKSHQITRRYAFLQGMRGLAFGALLSTTVVRPQSADAALFGGKERRQLDYCLVNLLRMAYWAESLVQDLKTTDDQEKRKKLYLEARLGAKALVTGKVGGGATNRVYQLSTLQLRGCLEDIAYYGKSRKVSELYQDLLESIAAVVEFDGLETTTDPSPRSSLTLSMYNPQKSSFVQRLLSERVIPIAEQLFNSFDPDVKNRCKAYVASTYPNEVPKQPVVEAVSSTSSTLEQ